MKLLTLFLSTILSCVVAFITTYEVFTNPTFFTGFFWGVSLSVTGVLLVKYFRETSEK